MTENFIIPIIFAVFIVFICIGLNGKRSPETIQGVATLLGIGGTFVGIIIALYGAFGVGPEGIKDIQKSTSELLDGIYPAFFSSLAGVLMALAVYLFPGFWKQKEESIDTESDTDSQILLELKNLNRNIIGDSETSLNTQLLKLRTVITDKHDELKKSFDAFAEKMTENNMKALEEVIKDFNTKLQEQFGENFKQLNKAVGDLLVWQENYKESIEKTNEEMQNMLKVLEEAKNSLGQSKESMRISADSLEEITRSANSFSENAESLRNQLEETKEAIGTINEFSKNLDGAAEGIKNNMDNIMNSTLENLGQNLKSISEALVRDYREIQMIISDMARNRNSQ